MNGYWCAAAVLGLALVGCQADHASADPVSFHLNQPFALGGGREASDAGDDVRVRFSDVLEDSRCPERVECFWTGQARVAIAVQPHGREPTTLEFNTNPAPGQTVSTGRAGDYTVTMQSLEPYPQTPDDPIPLPEYRVTLTVTKG
ncbi:hypothetical protein [Mycobacterium antarcticum]|uniref:hypothetical protein n=1 Tax=unclassified Mycolicibacterium TaxID=2636767 RepID=UPI0024E185AE|nr:MULTISPECIES: hypothetical protein [unclassified Mycolicibacterium]